MIADLSIKFFIEMEKLNFVALKTIFMINTLNTILN